MFTFSGFFCSYAVNNLREAKEFYSKMRGLKVSENKMGILEINSKKGQYFIIYPKKDHQPAGFTVMNFPVENIEEAVSWLNDIGVQFEQYQGELKTDENGIHRSKGEEPNIAWFKDPAGNILSVIEEKK